ncbi:hypothetical protein MKX03_017555 [Papaver bracteatum]|nr:hypothetical protein MKX03_017555 [Papaver bracteatum]
MRGSLCLAYEYAMHTDLWMLKKNTGSSNLCNAGSSTLCNAKDEHYKSRSWIKESQIGFPCVNRGFKIFGLTQEGKVMLKDIRGSLSQYSTSGGTKFYHTDSYAFYFRIISHVNSFISLKALGEANVETCVGSKDADVEGIRKRKSVPAYIVEDYYSLL